MDLRLPVLLILLGTIPAVTSLGQSPDAPPYLCKVHHPSDERIAWECRRVRSGENLEKLFGDRWQDVARFNRIDRRHVYPGVSLKVPEDLDAVVGFTPMPESYPPAEGLDKFILVDLSEQFLGVYEKGHLVFSSPIATGEPGNETPVGEFRITAYHKDHRSSLYRMEDTEILYPMNYALRFYINEKDVAFWIHGRDLPGYPASHGCIGLYDEPMQKKYYHDPKEPVLEDARRLYEWALGDIPDDGNKHLLKDGPQMQVIGQSPRISSPRD